MIILKKIDFFFFFYEPVDFLNYLTLSCKVKVSGSQHFELFIVLSLTPERVNIAVMSNFRYYYSPEMCFEPFEYF